MRDLLIKPGKGTVGSRQGELCLELGRSWAQGVPAHLPLPQETPPAFPAQGITNPEPGVRLPCGSASSERHLNIRHQTSTSQTSTSQTSDSNNS